MHNQQEAFLKILLLELYDLESDLKALQEEYRDKHDHEIITNYVFYENIALLQRELFGIDSFVEDIKKLAPVNYATLDEMVATITELLEDRVREKCLVPAVLHLVSRKVKKAAQYVVS